MGKAEHVEISKGSGPGQVVQGQTSVDMAQGLTVHKRSLHKTGFPTASAANHSQRVSGLHRNMRSCKDMVPLRPQTSSFCIQSMTPDEAAQESLLSWSAASQTCRTAPKGPRCHPTRGPCRLQRSFSNPRVPVCSLRVCWDSHITQIHGYDAVHLPRNPGKIRTRRASGGSGDSGVNVRRQKLMACTPSPKKNKKRLSLLDLSEAFERFPRLRQMKRANKASPGSARNSKSPAQVRRPGPPPILFTSQSDGY